MNVGGGEAADQMVRMMLSGTEVAVRLSGSALKNLLALSLALARNHKQLSGKVNLGKMLRETRDLRQFPMTPEQYRQFEKLAKKQKLLFSTIRDQDERGKLVDVILPVTELDRANQIFERLLSQVSSQEKDVSDLQKAPQERQDVPVPEHRKNPPKKDFRSERDSPDTRPRSSTPSESADIFSLIRAVGLILLGYGILQVGLSLQSHDPSQRSNGILTIAGGIVITFTKEILTLITGG